MQKQKNKIIESLRINSKDVGSSEVQIGLLSDKITYLSNHFKEKDVIEVYKIVETERRI